MTTVENAGPGDMPPADGGSERMPGSKPRTPVRWRRRWVWITAIVLISGSVGFGVGQSSGISPEAQKQIDAADANADTEAHRADQAEATLRTKTSGLTARSDGLDDREAALDRREAGLDTRESQIAAAEKAAEANSFAGDGIYLIGTDIQPGTYKAAASPDGNCYYAILNSLDGSLDAIRENNNTSGPLVIQVPANAKALEVSGCATFQKTG